MEEKIKKWSKDKLEEKLVLLYNETEISITLAESGRAVFTLGDRVFLYACLKER